MGEPLGHPHVVLVQRVAGRVRVRGPVGAPVREHRDHVVPDRVGVERVGEGARAGRLVARRHRVHHLRRHQHRHRRPLGLVPLEVGVEPLVEQVAHQLAQLPDVLDAVRPLPLHRRPLLGGDVLPAGEAGPVGLDQLDPAVGVGLAGRQTDGGLDAHGARVRGECAARPLPRRKTSCPAPGTTEEPPPWPPVTVIPPVCTGSSTTPSSCRRRPGGSTPAPSCGPTRSGSGSRSSTSTRRRTASSSGSTRPATAPSTTRACAPRSSRSWPPAARCRTPRPAPAACSSAPSRRSGPTRRSASRWGTGSPRSSP